MRRFAMVLVALLMASGSAVADRVDPAVTAMLRTWSLLPPSAFRVVICHGFGCAFRTEVGLGSADHAQMAAIMASGAASPQAERAAIGRTEAWFERRIAPFTAGTARPASCGRSIPGRTKGARCPTSFRWQSGRTATESDGVRIQRGSSRSRSSSWFATVGSSKPRRLL